MIDRDQHYASQDFDPPLSAHEVRVFTTLPLLTDNKHDIFSLFIEYTVCYIVQHFGFHKTTSTLHAVAVLQQNTRLSAQFHHQLHCKFI